MPRELHCGQWRTVAWVARVRRGRRGGIRARGPFALSRTQFFPSPPLQTFDTQAMKIEKYRKFRCAKKCLENTLSNDLKLFHCIWKIRARMRKAIEWISSIFLNGSSWCCTYLSPSIFDSHPSLHRNASKLYLFWKLSCSGVRWQQQRQQRQNRHETFDYRQGSTKENIV